MDESVVKNLVIIALILLHASSSTSINNLIKELIKSRFCSYSMCSTVILSNVSYMSDFCFCKRVSWKILELNK